MQLTIEQSESVKTWIENGAGLGEVQRRIKEEFGIALTYMDTRFLVLDIGATIKDKETPKQKETPKPPVSAEPLEDSTATDVPGKAPTEEDELETLPGGNVSVTIDKIVRAGALASGTVTFSNGVVNSWILDRMGRLAFTKTSDQSYQPTQADLEAFQFELQSLLQQQGY